MGAVIAALGFAAPSASATNPAQVSGPVGTYISVAASPWPALSSDDVAFTLTVRTATGEPVTEGFVSLNRSGPAGRMPDQIVAPDADGEVTWVAPAGYCCFLQAAYLGRGGHESSSYAFWEFAIARFGTSVAVSTSGPSSAGEVVTFTALISSARPVAAGEVTFRAVQAGTASTAIEQQAVVGTDGRASVSARLTTDGTYTITASYAGDEAFAPSSGSVALLVGCVDPPAPTELALTAPAPISLVGEAVTFTAAVTAPDGPVETGTVDFRAGTASGVVDVDTSGIASWTAPANAFPEPFQLEPVSAQYSPGIGNYLPSSATIEHRTTTATGTVPGVVTISVSPNPVVLREPATVTVTARTLDGAPYPLDRIAVFQYFPYTDTDFWVPIVDGTGSVTRAFAYTGTILLRTQGLPESAFINVNVLPAASTTQTTAPPPPAPFNSTSLPDTTDVVTAGASPDPTALSVATAPTIPTDSTEPPPASTSEPPATSDPSGPSLPPDTEPTADATPTSEAVAAGFRSDQVDTCLPDPTGAPPPITTPPPPLRTVLPPAVAVVVATLPATN